VSAVQFGFGRACRRLTCKQVSLRRNKPRNGTRLRPTEGQPQPMKIMRGVLSSLATIPYSRN